MVPASAVPLPSPGVRLGADYLARVERLVPRVRAARERREGPGKRGLVGSGLEFEGYRPYRPGESLRGIDWTLYARLDRPFVRIARREASERWALLLDTSASMGVGRPGKLQAACEVAGALASLALGQGAVVEILASTPREGATASIAGRKPADWPRVLAFLQEQEASGERGLERLVREPARFRAAGRVIAIGDLLDLEPSALFGAGRRGRELACVQVLAPEELLATTGSEADGRLADTSVVWVDAENAERLPLRLTRATRAAYEAELSRTIAAWRTACARHRALFGTWVSTAPFEDVCAALVGA